MVDVAIIPPPLGPQLRVSGENTLFLQIDCGVSYSHDQTASIPEHPIETGSNVNDHRQVNRPRLKLTGINAARPIFPSDEEANGLEQFDAYDILRGLFESGELVDIVTPLRFYESMQMASISVPQDKTKGGTIEFSVEFVEVEFVDSETVTLQPAPGARKAKSNRGKKPTTTAPEKASDGARSTLSGFFTKDRAASIAGG